MVQPSVKEISLRMQAICDRADKYLEEKGYVVVQRNGQRISTRKDLTEDNGLKHCEVFVGKLPRDMFEDELLPVMERAGRISKVRLMMDFSRTNRGFAFIKYTHPNEAAYACRLLNKSSIRQDTPAIGVLLSFDNKRLWFGNLPGKCTKERLLSELRKILDNVEEVRLPETNRKNPETRYAFVSFKTHEAATQARRVLVPGDVRIMDRTISVDWAVPDSGQNQSMSSTTGGGGGSKYSSSSSGGGRAGSSPGRFISMTNNNCRGHNNSFNDINNNNNNINYIDHNNNYHNNGYRRQMHQIQNHLNSDNQIQNHLDPNDINIKLAGNSIINNDINLLNNNILLNSPPLNILGTKAKRMLEDHAPVLLEGRSCYITICNIRPGCADMGQLKRIFQLADRLKIVRMCDSGFDSITIQYETCEQADLMLEALVMMPDCFDKLALPDQILLAYRRHPIVY